LEKALEKTSTQGTIARVCALDAAERMRRAGWRARLLEREESMAGKRRDMDEAGISKGLDGYRVRVTLRDESGRRFERQARCSTYAEAVRVRDELRATPSEEPSPARSDETPPTVVAYCDTWIGERRASGRCARSTLKNYVTCLSRLCDALGDVRLDRLRRADLQRWGDALARTYAPRTARATWATCLQTLRDGWADFGLADPSARLRPPPGPDEPAGRVLSLDELGAALAAARAESPALRTLLLVLAGTGMRRLEACSLRREDLFLDGDVSHLRPSSSKTKAGRGRVIPLAPQVAAELEAWLVVAPPSPWVWPMPTDPARHYSPDTLAAGWRRALEAAGVPHAVLHDLRRTWLTHLHAAQADVVTRRLLAGHARDSEQERYIRPSPSTLAQAVSPLWRILEGGASREQEAPKKGPRNANARASSPGVGEAV